MVAKNVGWLHPSAGDNSGDPFNPFYLAFDAALNLGGIQPNYTKQWGHGDYSAQWRMTAAQQLATASLDIIVAPGGAVTGAAAIAAVAAQKKNISVVFTSGGDLSDLGQLGLSASNATGVVMGTTNSVRTRVNVLRQLIGSYPEIAVFLRSGTKLYYEELAMTTQLNLMPVNASGFLNNDGSVNFVDMLDYADDQGAAAVLVCADPSFMDQRTALIKAINDAGVPAAYPFRAYVYGGGLMSVGPDLTTVYSQVGRIAAQILNGSSPPIYNATDLPVWINLGTAGTLRKAGVLSASDATLTSLATASGGGVNPPAP